MSGPRRILLTGCSGAGKSTLIAGMGRRGWTTVSEPGRRIVRSASGPDDPALPWNDGIAFARKALSLARHDWLAARAGSTLFDRGIVDAVTALRRAGAATPADEEALGGFRYAETVYLAPPWPELFQVDTERRHDLAEAEAEYAALAETLPNLGYRIVTVPRMAFADRLDWWQAALTEAP